MFNKPNQPGQVEPISISCRFITTDQWLRTRVDPTWTIFELKRHLLAKCVGGVALVPNPAPLSSGPRLLKPSQQGLVTLAGLVHPPHAPAIKTGGRPSTAPHTTGDDGSRRKPRLSLKVVPGLNKPGPRTVTIHPPTPGIFGAPTVGATGPQPAPPIYFSPRNPFSSPELSPPHFTPATTLEDESSPSSPNTQHDTMSTASRSTVALPYSQPQSHATSPTFSTGASPPSRPFSPTSLPRPAESQPLFSPDHPMFADFSAATTSPVMLRSRSTPPLSRAMSSPPSPYSPKPSTPLTSRPTFPLPLSQHPPNSPPASTTRSPPFSSSLTSRLDAASQISISDTTADSILESDTTQSPLLSAVEFLDLESEGDPDGSYDLAMRSPSPPAQGMVSASSGSTVFATRSIAGSYPECDARETGRERAESRNWEVEFRLVSFAQGCFLEEHTTIADMRIRPGELLEIQRANTAVRLARPTYTQPYFEAPVYVIKRTPTTHQSRPQTSHHAHVPPRPHQHHIQPMRDYLRDAHGRHGSSIPEVNPPMSPVETTSGATRVRSRTVTARDMYDGMSEKWEDDNEQDWAELELSGLEGVGDSAGTDGRTGAKGPGWNDHPSANRPPEGSTGGDKIEWKLRWLTMREGTMSLSRSRAKQSQPLITRPLSTVLAAQQLPALPPLGALPHSYISIHFNPNSRKERERERDCEIGIRMMDGAAHAHLLRVLLRIINTPGPHRFLNTDTPYFASAPLPSQYPEWRQYIVQRAWLAGRGTSVVHGSIVAGPWMRSPWMAWTDKEAEAFSDDDASQLGDEYDSEDDDDLSNLYESQIGAMEGFDHAQRDSESEIEWDVEGWRAWESENAFGNSFGAWSSGNSSWIKNRVEGVGAGRPRSRSLATPSSRSSSMNQSRDSPQQGSHPMYPYPSQQPYLHTDKLLSPVSTSSDLSTTTSPNARRARSSTIAGPTQPDSPGSSSPTAWSPVLPGPRRPLTSGTAGIETILRTPTAEAGTRRPSTQSRNTQPQRAESDRRGSANSLEMQRAHGPASRRAVTSPAPSIKLP